VCSASTGPATIRQPAASSSMCRSYGIDNAIRVCEVFVLVVEVRVVTAVDPMHGNLEISTLIFPDTP